MWPGVLEAILGRVPVASSACLKTGFRRLRVPDCPYPGLARGDGAGVTHGLILSDLAVGEVAALDLFEGNAYRATAVRPHLVDGVDDAYAWATSAARRDASALALGDAVDATVYLYADPAGLIDVLWEPAHFAPSLVAWTARCQLFSQTAEVAELRRAARAELDLRR
jgi:hypothetical protein